MTKDKKDSSKTIDKRTGMLTEKVDLTNHPEKENQTESPMLPHERDESSGPASTQKPGDERSRKLIKKAHEDTRRGLVDTDRRGIPSDIEESDIPAADDIPNVSNHDEEKKR